MAQVETIGEDEQPLSGRPQRDGFGLGAEPLRFLIASRQPGQMACTSTSTRGTASRP